MRMSEIIMSNNLASKRWRPNSPLVAISTRCPSFRKVISRSSQMDRSSSTMRMLAILSHPRQFHGELRPAVFFRRHRYAPAVGVDDLVNDGQPQSGAPRKSRLKGLEYF